MSLELLERASGHIKFPLILSLSHSPSPLTSFFLFLFLLEALGFILASNGCRRGTKWIHSKTPREPKKLQALPSLLLLHSLGTHARASPSPFSLWIFFSFPCWGRPWQTPISSIASSHLRPARAHPCLCLNSLPLPPIRALRHVPMLPLSGQPRTGSSRANLLSQHPVWPSQNNSTVARSATQQQEHRQQIQH